MIDIFSHVRGILAACEWEVFSSSRLHFGRALLGSVEDSTLSEGARSILA